MWESTAVPAALRVTVFGVTLKESSDDQSRPPVARHPGDTHSQAQSLVAIEKFRGSWGIV